MANEIQVPLFAGGLELERSMVAVDGDDFVAPEARSATGWSSRAEPWCRRLDSR